MGLVKVALIQKVPMHSSYPQTDESNCFPEFESLIAQRLKGQKGFALQVS